MDKIQSQTIIRKLSQSIRNQHIKEAAYITLPRQSNNTSKTIQISLILKHSKHNQARQDGLFLIKIIIESYKLKSMKQI